MSPNYGMRWSEESTAHGGLMRPRGCCVLLPVESANLRRVPRVTVNNLSADSDFFHGSLLFDQTGVLFVVLEAAWKEKQTVEALCYVDQARVWRLDPA